MGNVPFHRRLVRRLTRNSSGTVSVSIPIEHADELGWSKGQLVQVDRIDQKVIITAVDEADLKKRGRA